MKDCLFCKIIRKEVPAEIIYEDDEFLAFFDISPQAKIHVILVPKRHINSVSEIKDDDAIFAGKILLAANKIANELKISETGYRIVTNVGKDAGQAVKHLHFHILGGQELGRIC